MLAVADPLKERLQSLPQLVGWDVRKWTEHADRKVLPSAELRCVGSGVADAKKSRATLTPQWLVTLVVRRSDEAEVALDAAMTAVFESLHGWAPGQHGGRGWEPFALAQITEPMLPDEGLVGYELIFNTAALYVGQQ